MFIATILTTIPSSISKPSFIHYRHLCCLERSIVISVGIISGLSSVLFVGAISHVEEFALRGGNVDTLCFCSYPLVVFAPRTWGFRWRKEYVEHFSVVCS